jgi:hypothetical protein
LKSSAILKKPGYILFIFTISLELCLARHALADNTPAYVSITSENDIYAPKAQDRHYTNGLRLAIGLSDSERKWYDFLDNLTMLGENRDRVQYELAFGQNIYTPEFLLTEELIPDDRPYAGWLYGELVATSHKPGIEESLVINFGLVGPAAFGEEFQQFNHSITGDEKPLGWRHQLKNEPALLLRYRRSRFTAQYHGDSVKFDAITRFGFNLGNVFTDTGAGLVLRMGNHLSEYELPVRIQPGLSGNSSFVDIRKDQIDWVIYTELSGRFVLHNIFLDGNVLRESHSISKKHVVWDVTTGVTFGFGQFRYPLYVSFSLIWRGKEFDLQQGIDNFGSAQIGLQF